MPFYEYQCGDCGHRLEVLQKISDDPLVYCPSCNEASLKKLISAAAFRLKGSGWYETDFKNNDKKKEKAEDSKPDQKADKNGATAKEGKSDTAKSDKGTTTPAAKSKDSHSSSAA